MHCRRRRGGRSIGSRWRRAKKPSPRWPLSCVVGTAGKQQVLLALAPTIPLHCSDAFMLACRDLARDAALGLHMHLGESKVQAVSGMRRYGRSLTAHLEAIGFLGANLTAAHAVWLDDDDIARLAHHGASVAHNPGSNLRLGSGVAPVRGMRTRGVALGIGTDGPHCSDNQNMFEAMRLAAMVSRIDSVDPQRWLSAEDALEMATEGGARVLGLEGQIGRIAPGYKADIVFLDLGHPNFVPLNDPTHQLVHTENGGAVDSVMVGRPAGAGPWQVSRHRFHRAAPQGERAGAGAARGEQGDARLAATDQRDGGDILRRAGASCTPRRPLAARGRRRTRGARVSGHLDAAAPAADFLVLDRLCKRYPNFVAVDLLDLQVAAGEFLTLLGPSGSGKTTTLMMIAGFTPPSAGDIRLKGRSIAALAPERRGFGVVFQSYALFPHMTVAENVGFPLRMRKLQRSVIQERVLNALQMVRLEGLGDRQPKQLSGGQQQRVALARALVFDPDVLLMDEPLGALDKNLREQMQVELKRLHMELGVTLLYVTHDQQEALSLSDRIALMQGGRIAQLGSAEDLYERPRSRFVAEFIGESNVIEGMVGEDGGSAWFVATGGDRFPVSGASQQSGKALLVVRPEKFSIGAAGGTGLEGEVSALTYLGDYIRYHVRTRGGLELTVKTQAKCAREGERIVLRLDGKDACILPE